MKLEFETDFFPTFVISWCNILFIKVGPSFSKVYKPHPLAKSQIMTVQTAGHFNISKYGGNPDWSLNFWRFVSMNSISFWLMYELSLGSSDRNIIQIIEKTKPKLPVM